MITIINMIISSVYIYIYICVHVNICISNTITLCVYIYIYIYIYIHTHTIRAREPAAGREIHLGGLNSCLMLFTCDACC